MLEVVWPSAQDIINANGQVIKNPDGTISVYTYNSELYGLSPEFLTKSWCDSLKLSGVTFDVEKQKCVWADDSCGSPVNVVLNTRGNDGTVFAVYPDQDCQISIDFDYLFKFDCNTLSDLIAGKISGSCVNITDVFENLGASVILETAPTQMSVNNVYEQTLFNPIGKGKLYNYLTSAGTNTGFFICGELIKNTGDTSCHALNLFDLKITGDTLNCAIPANTLLTQLYNQSGLTAKQFSAFTSSINANAFGPNWQHFHTTITDPTVISAITNQKIKLSVRISGMCIDTCLLVDNIQLNQECNTIYRNDIYLAKSPGFDLSKKIDNKKSWVAYSGETERLFNISRQDNTNEIRYTDYTINDSRLVLNTKEVDLDLNLATAIETDVWNYVSNNPCVLSGVTMGTSTCIKNAFISYDKTSGVVTCGPVQYCCSDYCGDANINLQELITQPISSVTTTEVFDTVISELIDVKNRKTIQSYPTLRLLYDRYLSNTNCNTQSGQFDYGKIDKFANLIGNYWVDIIEQFIPATTIWGSTKIYTNTLFDEQKFKYKQYSLLFGFDATSTVVPLSPATGVTCSTSATTSVIEGIYSDTAQFFTQGQNKTYSNVYVKQMNSGSEFYGTVNIIGVGNTPNSLNECSLGVTLNTINPTTGATTSGSITANVYGANGPVTYLWNNLSIGQTITGLSAGTYNVTVSDTSILGCTVFTQATLTNN